MNHDHQLERHTISDVEPVELLMEQLTEPCIVFASVAGDARGSTQHSLQLVSESLRSTGENRIAVNCIGMPEAIISNVLLNNFSLYVIAVLDIANSMTSSTIGLHCLSAYRFQGPQFKV